MYDIRKGISKIIGTSKSSGSVVLSSGWLYPLNTPVIFDNGAGVQLAVADVYGLVIHLEGQPEIDSILITDLGDGNAFVAVTPAVGFTHAQIGGLIYVRVYPSGSAYPYTFDYAIPSLNSTYLFYNENPYLMLNCLVTPNQSQVIVPYYEFSTKLSTHDFFIAMNIYQGSKFPVTPRLFGRIHSNFVLEGNAEVNQVLGVDSVAYILEFSKTPHNF